MVEFAYKGNKRGILQIRKCVELCMIPTFCLTKCRGGGYTIIVLHFV